MPHLRTKRGLDWYYTLDGTGEVLVLIHGWAGDSQLWIQQREYFIKDYRVITIDLPGHGDSSWKKLSLKEIVVDLNEILKKLRVWKINVIGSSLGGLVALKLFGFDPDRVTRVILVGALPKFCQSAGYPFGLKRERIRMLGKQVKTDYPEIVNIFFRSLFTMQERQSPRFKWLNQFRKREQIPQQEALQGFLEILEKEDAREDFQKVIKMQKPFQILNGTDDYICSQEAIQFLKTQYPQIKVDFFQHCGHFPFLTKPLEFNQAVEHFLRKQ